MSQTKANSRTSSDYLEHYGIKGMKWGVRRTPEQLGRRTFKKRKQSDEYRRSREIKKKRVFEMTNQELRDLNNRLQLEKSYKDLKKSQSVISKGKQASNKALKTVGKVGSAALAIAAVYKVQDKIIEQYRMTPAGAEELKNAFKSAKIIADLLAPKKK